MNAIERRLAHWMEVLRKPDPAAADGVVGSRDRTLRGKARIKARKAARR
jgi:hypothetical protein